MIPEITSAWTGISIATKAISSVLKTVKDIETKQAISDVQDNLIDVQSKLFAIQSQYEALAEVKREMQQKLVEYEKWDAEASRYELKQIASGIFVYSLKPNDASTESTHWLCPNCFDQRQKSILSKPHVDHLNYKCHRCGFDIVPIAPEWPHGDDISFGGGGIENLM